jgi:hypothetical protein
MIRRTFLRLLGLAPIAAVATQLPAPAVAASPWKLEWFEKENLWDGKVVYAIRATNLRTGEVKALGYLGDTRGEQRQRAKTMLKAWAKDLSAPPTP